MLLLFPIFRHFPQARFIHVIRDGRDTICSLRHHMSYQIKNGASTTNPTSIPFSPASTVGSLTPPLA